MNKEQKAAAVEGIAGRLQEAEAIFAVDYRGISVPQAAELRSRLAEADAVFSIVKNRLAKLAAEQAGTEGLDDLLVGPTALTLIRGDAVIAAKAISSFSREHEVLAFKGGLMDGAPLDPEGFAAIARLPALDVLHGQLVGVTASPLTGLVRGLGSMLSGLAVALAEIRERGLVSGEAPPAEHSPPAEDSPPAEAPPAVEAEAEDAAAGEGEQAVAEPQAEAESEVAGAGEEAEAEGADDEPDAGRGEAEAAAGDEEDE